MGNGLEMADSSLVILVKRLSMVIVQSCKTKALELVQLYLVGVIEMAGSQWGYWRQKLCMVSVDFSQDRAL